jgi:hypothetical protein
MMIPDPCASVMETSKPEAAETVITLLRQLNSTLVENLKQQNERIARIEERLPRLAAEVPTNDVDPEPGVVGDVVGTSDGANNEAGAEAATGTTVLNSGS